MALHRVTVRWSGFLGAPGYSAFHFMAGGGLVSDAQSSASRVGAGLQHLTTLLPDGVVLAVQPEVEELNEATGETTGFVNVTPPESVEGGGVGGYSAASGAVVNWRTNDLRNGRRIRGRTFLVPLVGSSYQADGTLGDQTRVNIGRFADELVGGDLDSELVVWSRPTNGAGGVGATVVGYSVPDMAAVLRSRRD